MRLPVLIFLFLTLFLFKPASTHADSGFLGRIGDSVQPMEHTQVEMVKKEINAEVTERYTYFEAVFTFHNDGPETTVLMGFPEASSQENGPPEEQPQGRFHQDLENFKTYLDGEKVAVEKEAGLLQEEGISNVYFPNWYTWEIDFSEGQTREVKNTYKAPNSMEGGFITSTGYIKSTGSTWQGSIGEARIKFILKDLSPHQLIFAVPPGFQIKDGNLVWEWEDFEPRHNIEMSFLSHLTGQSREFHLPEKIIETWDSWDEKLASGNYSEVLKEAEKILQETGPDENDDEKVKLHYLAKAYRSLAKENLGHSERAIANWESLLADIGAPETMMEPLKDYVYKKTCYHLAGLYHDTGRDPQLEELYNKLLESPPNAPLKRIVESFLPPEKIKRAEPVISEFSIQQDGKLHLRAEDSDGDLAEVIFTLWEEQNGAKNIISEQQLPTYNAYYTYFYHDMTPGMEMNPAALYEWGRQFHLNEIFPEAEDLEPATDYYFAVEIHDFAGNKTSTEPFDFDPAYLAAQEEPDDHEDPDRVTPGEEAPPEEKEAPEETAPDLDRQPGNQPFYFGLAGITLVVTVGAAYLLKKRFSKG